MIPPASIAALLAQTEVQDIDSRVVIAVVAVVAWAMHWWYSHSAHQREAAAAREAAKARMESAVQTAVEEERKRAASYEPRHDPELHEQFIPRPEYERDRAETRTELARHSASRKAIYEKLEEQGRQISAMQNGIDAQSELVAELRRDVKDDFGGVHTRINDVLTAVCEVRGELKARDPK